MDITFILRDGRKEKFQFEDGQTILDVARKNGINLNSNCEGFGVCGSCHVFIENFFDKLCPPTDKENDTLDKVSGVTINSRLACQVILNKNLDGLIVRVV